MKKELLTKLLASFFIILSSSYLYAGDWSFSAEPVFGIRNGTIGEYVFERDSAYDSDKLSYLEWDIENTPYVGLKLLTQYNRFAVETSFEAGIPGSSGSMADSDWLNLQTSGLDNYQYKTTYSESDNHYDYDYRFNLKASYNFKPHRLFNIVPFAALDLYTYQYTASDTYQVCGYEFMPGCYYPYNDTNSKHVWSVYIDGDTITYKQVGLNVWTGLDVQFTVNPRSVFTAGFHIAPYSYIECYDSHLARSTDFLDVISAGFDATKLTASYSFLIDSKNSFSCNLCWYNLNTVRGPDYYKYSSEDEYNETSADGGTDWSYLDISFSYKYKFF